MKLKKNYGWWRIVKTEQISKGETKIYIKVNKFHPAYLIALVKRWLRKWLMK